MRASQQVLDGPAECLRDHLAADAAAVVRDADGERETHDGGDVRLPHEQRRVDIHVQLVHVDVAARREQQADAEPDEAHLDPAVQHAQRVVEDLREAAIALAGDAVACLAGQRQAAGHGEVEERRDDQPRHAVDAPVAAKRHREEVVSDHLGGKDRHHAHEDDADAYEHLPERNPLVVVPHTSSEHPRL